MRWLRMGNSNKGIHELPARECSACATGQDETAWTSLAWTALKVVRKLKEKREVTRDREAFERHSGAQQSGTPQRRAGTGWSGDKNKPAGPPLPLLQSHAAAGLFEKSSQKEADGTEATRLKSREETPKEGIVPQPSEAAEPVDARAREIELQPAMAACELARTERDRERGRSKPTTAKG